MLCILTSKKVLSMTFAGLNHLFACFYQLFLYLLETVGTALALLYNMYFQFPCITVNYLKLCILTMSLNVIPLFACKISGKKYPLNWTENFRSITHFENLSSIKYLLVYVGVGDGGGGRKHFMWRLRYRMSNSSHQGGWYYSSKFTKTIQLHD